MKYLPILLLLPLSINGWNQNIGINTPTPNAALDVHSTGNTSATFGILVSNSSNDTSLVVSDNGNVGIGTTLPVYSLDVQSSNPIAARFSGRVAGQDAVNANEYATLQQLQTSTSNISAGYFPNPTQFSSPGSTNITFFEALRYCKNLVENNYSDWRMPTAREFIDMYKDDAVVFPSLSNGSYWLDKDVYTRDNGVTYGLYFVVNGSSDYIDSYYAYNNSAKPLCVR